MIHIGLALLRAFLIVLNGTRVPLYTVQLYVREKDSKELVNLSVNATLYRALLELIREKMNRDSKRNMSFIQIGVLFIKYVLFNEQDPLYVTFKMRLIPTKLC